MKTGITVQKVNTSKEQVFNDSLRLANVMILDSSDPNSDQNRWTIIGVDPQKTLTDLQSLDDFTTTYTHKKMDSKLPFTGGLIGYMTYEAAQALEDFSGLHCFHHPQSDTALPPIHFAVITQCILIEHDTGDVYYVMSNYPDLPVPEAWDVIEKKLGEARQKDPGKTAVRQAPQPQSQVKMERYHQLIARAAKHIHDGDIYQVNLSHRFELDMPDKAYALYASLRRNSPAPFSAYLTVGENTIMSASPECFVKIHGRNIETRPIKGTRPRGRNQQEDEANRADLEAASKDQAELLMITDLERNDLGKICEYGSVEVEHLKAVESYAQVHHLVSKIRGKLKPDIRFLDVLAALFPGGSITGAPKRRSMEIIYDLESVPRQVYTGTIGYISWDGACHMNIAIRTMYTNGNKLYFHAGGGIVADSDPQKEWEETLTKASGIMGAIAC